MYLSYLNIIGYDVCMLESQLIGVAFIYCLSEFISVILHMYFILYSMKRFNNINTDKFKILTYCL